MTTSADAFEQSYQGAPPWETQRPQPEVVRLAAGSEFAGRVLDVGCGTGENALYLASVGHEVFGVDGSPTAIERATAKAQQRGLAVEFEVADAFDLVSLGRRFDTVLDSAFMHIPGNTPARRRAYTDQLAAVVESGGRVHLLEISEQVVEHPSMTTAEILEAFDDRWTGARVRPATYLITSGEVPAWLVSLERA